MSGGRMFNTVKNTRILSRFLKPASTELLSTNPPETLTTTALSRISSLNSQHSKNFATSFKPSIPITVGKNKPIMATLKETIKTINKPRDLDNNIVSDLDIINSIITLEEHCNTTTKKGTLLHEFIKDRLPKITEAFNLIKLPTGLQGSNVIHPQKITHANIKNIVNLLGPLFEYGLEEDNNLIQKNPQLSLSITQSQQVGDFILVGKALISDIAHRQNELQSSKSASERTGGRAI